MPEFFDVCVYVGRYIDHLPMRGERGREVLQDGDKRMRLACAAAEVKRFLLIVLRGTERQR